MIRTDPRIDMALDYAKANTQDRISVSQLAEVAGLSPSRFSHLFSITTGITPSQFLRIRKQRSREERPSPATVTQPKLRPMPALAHYRPFGSTRRRASDLVAKFEVD